MKNSISHLPLDKQQELTAITESITELVKPEMVILFGSYSRGDWVQDRYKEDGITYEYKSDYDILVVTEKPKEAAPGFGKKVRRKIKKAEHLQTTPHIIFHDIDFLNKELEEGHYFFADIVKEGTMLYNTGKFELAKPKELSPYHRAQKAKLYYDSWFRTASEFLETYYFDFGKKFLPVAAFQLHQSAERYFMTIALVFTDYKPKTHDLEDLNKQTCYLDTRFKVIFPNETAEEKRLFKILVKAYIDSRYKLGYTVAAEDLQWLAGRVEILKGLTKEVCEEKIEGLGR